MKTPKLVLLPPQTDLPEGDTFRCTACGARVRRGGPHGGLRPYPHNTVEACVVVERKE